MFEIELFLAMHRVRHLSCLSLYALCRADYNLHIYEIKYDGGDCSFANVCKMYSYLPTEKCDAREMTMTE